MGYKDRENLSHKGKNVASLAWISHISPYGIFSYFCQSNSKSDADMAGKTIGRFNVFQFIDNTEAMALIGFSDESTVQSTCP